ncbi:hypothetical protein NE237_028073 [Protea cynaroides]|uniref:Bidirectional sugar transporter SWEET n=1 Tax=Protea cynaroides TaxID=273540 RepID=A0A9Q0JTK7_9MAGN|nr:hypothetical protein NE237_028073 [Protea cynaroides]
MGFSLRLAVGIIGNGTSLLLYAAPILTFIRVIKKRSTEEFSFVPYIVALLNCSLYTWYGLPVVSNEWENLPLVTINGLGILMEFTFILIYFWFSSTKEKKVVALVAASVITAICITGLVSTFAFHSHRQRKAFVGSIGLVASIVMYGSPLVVMKQVIKTKSVEFMPFYLSLFSFLASSLWMTYGLLSHDLFLASPNLLGSPLGLFQIILYCMYCKRGIREESSNRDLETNGVEIKTPNGTELKSPQHVIINRTNGKI